MKSWLLILLFGSSVSAFGTASDDFYRGFPDDSPMISAEKAYTLCDQLFSQWPNPSYQATVIQLGNDLTAHSEAAYFLLNTCQTQWVARYLDPLKPSDPNAKIDHSRLAFLLSAWSLIQKSRYVHEQIRLFTELYLPPDPAIPTAPYVLLAGLAATVQDMDESIHTEMRTAYTVLANVIAMPVYYSVAQPSSTASPRAPLLPPGFPKV